MISPNVKPVISSELLSRVCISIIYEFQENLINHGVIDRSKSIRSVYNRNDAKDITMDEEQLGLDSVNLIRLASRISQFFGLHSSGCDDYLLVNRTFSGWISIISKHIEITSDDTCFTFLTSGTTGSPKPISKSLEELLIEARQILNEFNSEFSRANKVLCLVPTHHIYGFIFGCLVPALHEQEAVDMQSAVPSAACSKAGAGDIIVATPFLWNLIADSGLQFPPKCVGITSGEPSNRKTWSSKTESNLMSLIEVFGSTETGGVGFRKSEGAKFTLFSHLESSEGAIISHFGEILDLQDNLFWTSPREFYAKGRRDSFVQVAGVNVSIEEIENILGNCPVVSSVRISFHDQVISADVLLTGSIQKRPLHETMIRDVIRSQLPPSARPQVLTFRSV